MPGAQLESQREIVAVESLPTLRVWGFSPTQETPIQKNRKGKGPPLKLSEGKQWRLGPPSKPKPQHTRQRVTRDSHSEGPVAKLHTAELCGRGS